MHPTSSFRTLVLCTGLFPLFTASGQDPAPDNHQPPDDFNALRQQMVALRTSLDQMRDQHEKEIAGLKSRIESQQTLIDKLRGAPAGDTAPPVALPAGETAEATEPETLLFPTTDDSVLAAPLADMGTGTSDTTAFDFPTTDGSVIAGAGDAIVDPGLAGPITVAGGGKNYLNVSFSGMFAGAASTAAELDMLEVGDHDPQQSGFNARNLELAFDGAVDPYFEGFANIVFKLNNEDETEVEAEEVFMQTTSLPWNLQLKGGQFFAPFGRINPTHPHTWDFSDTPLVQGRFLGPDGLRGVGAQASWLTPLPWYSQLMFAIQNGNGGTGYSFRNVAAEDGGKFFGRKTIDRSLRSPGDMIFVPRWENSFDLSPTQTVLLGVSGAFGANDTGENTDTQILGLDLFYKWKPANASGGWPFVKWQTEAMFRRFEAGRGANDSFPVNETFNDWGLYSQLVWGFRRGWTAGLRGDYLNMENSPYTDALERQSRERVSANLTFYPTEFSKLRLQYNYDILEASTFLDSGHEHSVFLQFEFSLGAHAAHKF